MTCCGALDWPSDKDEAPAIAVLSSRKQKRTESRLNRPRSPMQNYSGLQIGITYKRSR